ncbi:Na+/H+ antiporter [Geminocystis sp. NIES-3708]|uniref:cation:proton antiporter n=1 Tax=Geminocystis sp. NIES-3708 TaxID=1615909 RepID=UPI0005FC6DB2|nr:cation:proton antiporter [Geminocystis sp. NIES-3708]BAQ61719.1 Na+/H+ antiporter [Geminocystis sp. NIES-3708]
MTWFYPVFAITTEIQEGNPSLILAGVLLSLVMIYFASKIGGELCSRIGLPSVLGELVGGVIIGMSALKLIIFPESGLSAEDSLIIQLLQTTANLTSGTEEVVFHSMSEVISVLSELGVIILLFEIGLKSEIKELIRVGPSAIIVAIGGVAFPFLLGTLGVFYLFHLPLIPSVFIGAVLTATSIGITAKVLAELGKLSSEEGQIIIGAAILDDILGIIILAVVANLAKTGEVEISQIVYLIITAATFLIGIILIGRLISPWLVTMINGMKTRGSFLLTSIVFAFIFSYIANMIELEGILGAFAAGLVLAETEKRRELEKQIIPIADIFVPIFFVCVGAKTDLSVLNPTIPSNRESLILASFLIVVAIIGKLVTGFTVWGQPHLNKLAIGVGMIPRGEVGLVFAGVGAATGAFNSSIEAAIIVMVIATTFIAPPLLKIVFKDKPFQEETAN